MTKAIKLQNDNYIDSSGVVHNRVPLNEILKPIVLYDNPNGTLENITLNQSVSKFEYIEIFYGRNGMYQSTKVFNPNGKKTQCNMGSTYISSNHIYCELLFSILSITDDKINKSSYGYYQTYDKTVNNVNTTGNYIYIYKVIGYK